MDRDLNAAMNLRRIGLETLRVSQPIIIDRNCVGQTLPEQGAKTLPTPVLPVVGEHHEMSGRLLRHVRWCSKF